MKETKSVRALVQNEDYAQFSLDLRHDEEVMVELNQGSALVRATFSLTLIDEICTWYLKKRGVKTL